MSKLNNKAYSLLEMVVSMSILIMILSVAVAALVYSMRLSAQTAALRNTQLNVRQALETMFRQIRLAQGFYDPAVIDTPNNTPQGDQCKKPRGFDPSSDRDQLIIKTQRGDIVRYRVKSAAEPVLIEENFGRCGAFNPGDPIVTRLTSPDIRICSPFTDPKGLSFKREDSYSTTSTLPNDPGGYTAYPPAAINIHLAVASPISYPDVCPPPTEFGQNVLRVEQTVTLRGEFSNFFQE